MKIFLYGSWGVAEPPRNPKPPVLLPHQANLIGGSRKISPEISSLHRVLGLLQGVPPARCAWWHPYNNWSSSSASSFWQMTGLLTDQPPSCPFGSPMNKDLMTDIKLCPLKKVNQLRYLCLSCELQAPMLETRLRDQRTPSLGVTKIMQIIRKHVYSYSINIIYLIIIH